MKHTLCLLSLLLVAGCSSDRGGTPLPVMPSEMEARSLDVLTGQEWSGVETASRGESGTVTAIFTVLGPQDVAATLTWTSNTSHRTYQGSLSGPLSNLVITAQNYGCGYRAAGSLNAAGTQISGTYAGTGPSPCPTKAGSFLLTGRPLSACHVMTYQGPATFSLPNSGDATELQYVRDHVSASLVSLGKIDNPGGTAWTADRNYSVVLVKAANVYALFVNVSAGQILQSPAFNQAGQIQSISHISLFSCGGVN